MAGSYATSDIAPALRSRFWRETIASVYFPLELRFASTAPFRGSLGVHEFGQVSVSRNVSDGLLYLRHERHLRQEREESYLITLPERSEIRFEQDGRDVTCRPGTLLVERSHLPYAFSHDAPASQWVMKVSHAVLHAHIGRPERLATRRFDVERGVGALFADMVRLSCGRAHEMEEHARAQIGRQLVELLALTVADDDRALAGNASSVRRAHLQRCEHFIDKRLGDGRLSPRMIAEACGLSLRYLHQLFEAEGTSVCAYIRTRRLSMCDVMLRDPACRKSISEIAYQCGFGDQAQFSRTYRARFGGTPREARAGARRACA